MVMDAQMEDLQVFFSENFERINTKGEEGEYDSLPKFVYFGEGTSNGKDSTDACVFFIFNDSVLLEGAEIYFLDCKKEGVYTVLDHIYQIASYAIDFSISLKIENRWRLVNPDYTSSKYPGC